MTSNTPKSNNIDMAKCMKVIEMNVNTLCCWELC